MNREFSSKASLQPDKVNSGFSDTATQNDKFYTKTWFIILSLVFICPLGLYLALRYSRQWFSNRLVAVIILIWSLGYLVCIGNSIMDSAHQLAYKQAESDWQVTVDEELQRNYWIDLDLPVTGEDVVIDCGLIPSANASSSSENYEGQDEVFKCRSQIISGRYSDYPSTKLTSVELGDQLQLDGTAFSFTYAPSVSVDQRFWETDDLENKLSNELASETINLTIYNDRLSSEVAGRSIHLVVKLNDEDEALIKQYQERYKAYQQQLADEETERETSEPAANTASTMPNTSTNTTGTVTNTNTSSSSNVNSSPSSDVNYQVSGYCIDGTFVTGDPSARGGANACYGHGGWRDY